MTTPPPTGPDRDGSDQPELLEPPGGEPAARERGGSRRTPLVVGGLVGVAAVVAGGAWAWSAFSNAGPQPSEALPASTLAYASVDLDPSGAQKLEAVRIVSRFPALRERLDLDTTDDLRERIVTELTGLADCDVDYADDVEPWLGDRFAVAALDRGDDQPTPVVVVQVSDAAGAEEGLALLAACEDDGRGGFAVGDDGWAVLAESDDVAAEVLADAADDPLTDDADHERWVGELGDPGFLNAWVAPEAGAAIAEQLESDASTGGMPDVYSEDGMDGMGGLDGMAGSIAPFGPLGLLGGGGVPPELTEQLEDFAGAALAVRFEDGALEVEAVGEDALDEAGLEVTDAAGEVVGDLPDGTVAALGLGFAEGWFGELVERVTEGMEPLLGLSGDDLLAQAESFTGLELPEDVETLVGEALVATVGEGFTVEGFESSEDGSDVPVGLVLSGGGEDAEAVLDKVRAALGEDDVLASDVEGDRLVVGPNADYRADLVEGGDLAGSDRFRSVVPDVDSASVVLFADLGADDWLVDALRGAGQDEVAENLAALQLVGLSATTDGDVSRFLLRLQTEG